MLRDYVFNFSKILRFKIWLILLSVCLFILAVTLYLMSTYFNTVSSEMIFNWYNTEKIALQQGNVLTAVSKLQRVIDNSSIIRAILVVDKSSNLLLEMGEFPQGQTDFSGVENTFVTKRTGLFSNIINYYSNGLKISFYNNSPFFYILALLIAIVFIVPLIGIAVYIKKDVEKTEQLKIDFEKEKIKSEKMYFEQIANLSKKLAHDIRSPISTLNLVSSKISDPDIKSIQLAVVEQINNIANGLLSNVKSINQASMQNSDHEKSIFSLFENLKDEYMIKAHNLNRKISFQNEIDLKSNQKISDEFYSVLYRCINNFIQNSIEATRNNDGEILISLYKNEDEMLVIEVKDNGKGIPSDILTKLGRKQISYGKENNEFNSGSGIALFNAKQDLLKFGTDLQIDSTLGVFTIVRILLKLD